MYSAVPPLSYFFFLIGWGRGEGSGQNMKRNCDSLPN